MGFAEGDLKEIEVVSSADGSEEKSIFFKLGGKQPRPLIVCLHPWSASMEHQVEEIVPLARETGCNAVFPEFRGPNLLSNPRADEACASACAMQDVVDVVDFLEKRRQAKKERVFLTGVSGGGHMALMMAAYRPEYWRAVIAFCPITDLAAWHAENKAYAPHMEACCGGCPGTARVDIEYRERSPVTHAEKIARSVTYIHHGKYDSSVPYTHSLNMYNKICAVNPEADVFLEIFNGGHEQITRRTREIINSRMDDPPE